MVKRELLEKITPYLNRREFIAVTGPRQCGKTVLFGFIRDRLKASKKTCRLVTFEDRDTLKQFNSDPVEFAGSYTEKSGTKSYLLIDEFQYAKNGGQKLKLIYDAIPAIKILVTGSSSLEIRAQTGKYMVGRMLNFQMYPFSFAELASYRNERAARLYDEKHNMLKEFIFKGKKAAVKQGQDIFNGEFGKKFAQYAIWGGYPAAALEKNQEQRKKILKEIQSNYILKDIKNIFELTTDDGLISLAERLAAQAGGIINYNSLGASAGFDYRNLKKHLKILEETYICSALKPFYANKLKELTKAPKIYFTDNGFRNSLTEDFRPLEKRQDAGSLVENAVYRRLAELCEESGNIRYWRTKAGAEVDFVIKTEGAEVPVEVKYSGYKSNRLTRSYMNFIESFKPPRGLVLTADYFGIEKASKTQVLFMPVYYL